MKNIDYHRSAAFFKLFSNENRLRIIMALFSESKTVGQITDQTGLSQSLVSQQLKLLKLQAVLSSERSGKTVTYQISDLHIRHLLQDVFSHLSE